MQYLGGALLEPPLPGDPGFILFLFFSLALAMAFISLSWLMTALTNLLYDSLVNKPRRSCKWKVSLAWYKSAFFPSVSMWYDPYWAMVLNYLILSNTLWFPCSRSRNYITRSRPADKWCARKAIRNSPHGM
jgi:hypothetical protein